MIGLAPHCWQACQKRDWKSHKQFCHPCGTPPDPSPSRREVSQPAVLSTEVEPALQPQPHQQQQQAPSPAAQESEVAVVPTFPSMSCETAEAGASVPARENFQEL